VAKLWVHPRFSPTQVRAIFFDVDGTLRDTDDELVQRLSRALGRLLPWVSEATRHRWARSLIMAAETPINALYAWADRWHLDNLLHRVWPRRADDAPSSSSFRLVPGVQTLIPRLAQHYPLAVVSAGSERAVRAFLAQTGLAPYFRAVVAGPTYTYTKPHPEPILATARALGVSPAHVLMVGDTTVDIRAAKAAGAQAVGVLCGFGTRDELLEAGADAILPHTSDLVRILPPVATASSPAAASSSLAA